MIDQTELASLSQSTLMWKQKFILKQDEIVREWTSLGGGNTGQKAVRLAMLVPDLGHQSVFGHNARHPITRGIILLLSALCIHFSAFSNDIPLLAPILLMLAIPFLIAGGSKMRQYEWTTLLNTKGDTIFFIPHNGTSSDERSKFEQALCKRLGEIHGNREDSQQNEGQLSSESALSDEVSS